MTIEINDADIQVRMEQQMRTTGLATTRDALIHLLDTQEEQDRWLLESRIVINAKLRRGIEQLDRGEGIPEDELDTWLADMKAKPE